MFFFFAEWAHVFAMCGVAAALFLGGWQLPGVSPAQQESQLTLQVLGTCVYVLKAWLLIAAVVFARWALPRLAVDRMVVAVWRVVLPIALVAFALTAAEGLWSPGRAAQRVMSMVVFAVFVLFAAYFAQRIRYGSKAPNARVALNPFL